MQIVRAISRGGEPDAYMGACRARRASRNRAMCVCVREPACVCAGPRELVGEGPNREDRVRRARRARRPRRARDVGASRRVRGVARGVASACGRGLACECSLV